MTKIELPPGTEMPIDEEKREDEHEPFIYALMELRHSHRPPNPRVYYRNPVEGEPPDEFAKFCAQETIKVRHPASGQAEPMVIEVPLEAEDGFQAFEMAGPALEAVKNHLKGIQAQQQIAMGGGIDPTFIKNLNRNLRGENGSG